MIACRFAVAYYRAGDARRLEVVHCLPAWSGKRFDNAQGSTSSVVEIVREALPALGLHWLVALLGAAERCGNRVDKCERAASALESIVSFIVPALVGIVVGILSGLLGVGGGTILVPVFRLAFGMSPVMSTATSLFTIIPTSISGAVSHIRHKTCVLPLGVAMGLGGAVTSPVGVWLATVSPGWLVMAAAAIIIAYSAVKMLGKAIKMKTPAKTTGVHGEPDLSGVSSSDGLAVSSTSSTSDASAASSRRNASEEGQRGAHRSVTCRQLAVGVCIGLFAGLASGYVGVGGGFIMVPLMMSFAGIAMKQASGTSLIAVAILAIPGVVEQALLGNVQYMAGIAVAVGTIPGAVVGARLVHVIPERQLRLLFGGFLVVAACVLILNEFGVLG